jgi:hypothetical protein
MKDETLAMCRIAGSTDPKIDAMLKFAAAIVRERPCEQRSYRFFTDVRHDFGGLFEGRP